MSFRIDCIERPENALVWTSRQDGLVDATYAAVVDHFSGDIMQIATERAAGRLRDAKSMAPEGP